MKRISGHVESIYEWNVDYAKWEDGDNQSLDD